MVRLHRGLQHSHGAAYSGVSGRGKRSHHLARQAIPLSRSDELRPEGAKTQPPALTSEGDRGRLLPGLLAVARSNMASYYLTDDL
jgi:hypothetical protein